MDHGQSQNRCAKAAAEAFQAPDSVGVDPYNTAPPRHWGTFQGQEPCDPEPVELPTDARRPDTLEEIFARLLHQTREREAHEGYDSPEEANDFSLPEAELELLDMTPYELAALEPEEPPPPLPESSEPPAASVSPDDGTPEPPELGE